VLAGTSDGIVKPSAGKQEKMFVADSRPWRRGTVSVAETRPSRSGTKRKDRMREAIEERTKVD